MIIHTAKPTNKGFSLVELLVVIAVVITLAGAVFVLINPVQQRRKASEAVLRANFSKMCLALNACGASYPTYPSCDSFADLGINSLTAPDGASYSISRSVNTIQLGASLPDSFGGGTCYYNCSFNFDTGQSANMVEGGASSCVD